MRLILYYVYLSVWSVFVLTTWFVFGIRGKLVSLELYKRLAISPCRCAPTHCMLGYTAVSKMADTGYSESGVVDISVKNPA